MSTRSTSFGVPGTVVKLTKPNKKRWSKKLGTVTLRNFCPEKRFTVSVHFYCRGPDRVTTVFTNTLLTYSSRSFTTLGPRPLHCGVKIRQLRIGFGDLSNCKGVVLWPGLRNPFTQSSYLMLLVSSSTSTVKRRLSTFSLTLKPLCSLFERNSQSTFSTRTTPQLTNPFTPNYETSFKSGSWGENTDVFWPVIDPPFLEREDFPFGRSVSKMDGKIHKNFTDVKDTRMKSNYSVYPTSRTRPNGLWKNVNLDF